VENPLARRIIAGEVRDGDVVQIDVGPGGTGGPSLVFRREARVEAGRARAGDGDEDASGTDRSAPKAETAAVQGA
jgi:hypothetical protein